MGSNVTILMRVVISKVLADKMAFESRLKGDLRESCVGIWRICISGRRNSKCKDSRQENTCKLKNKEARVGHRSKGSVRRCAVLQTILMTLALTGTKLQGYLEVSK